MYLDFPNRVENIRLAKSNCLLPLFEAIVNSMHAIEEAKRRDGFVVVTVEREPSPVPLTPDYVETPPVRGFVVEDNGIGFNEENFRSFTTSDTTHKKRKGGKGVGRLLWLKAFDHAEVESTYRDNGSFRRRRFDFTLSQVGVQNPTDDEVPGGECRTLVRLVGLRPVYREKFPNGLSTIANRIVEHFLQYFALKTCPKITLREADDRETIDLADFFAKEMEGAIATSRFKIRHHPFQMIHVMVATARASQHRMHFCAHSRAVKAENLSRKIVDLGSAMKREDGVPFFYAGYVTGDYLDATVTTDRTEFDVLREPSPMEFPDELSWPEIVDGAIKRAAEFLSPYTKPVREAKTERIEKLVKTAMPEYRPLLHHKPEVIDLISAELTDDQIETELHRHNRAYEAELKERGKSLLAGKDADEAFEEHRKPFEEFLEQWNELGIAQLARHVVHRKATLSFLEKRLELTPDGRYSKEEAVHEIVFPLKTTSDDVPVDKANLWIIDEKPAYHHYLSSDRPFKSVSPVGIDSKDRADLIIFNHPIAFVESGPPFGSITIIEFKRPTREDYDDDENPISQVCGYVEQIRAGTAKDKKGKLIEVAPNIPFYAYVICSLTKRLRHFAKLGELIPTPDGSGYFGYKANFGVYLEIISFQKLVADAKKRNAALFDKLNMPYK